ncbi:hypothetical protein GCM10018962_17660 [Dactylosporangium matsuzakiense]|uniref:N-acetyltransferase domain-containing protein n=1 Tax=Dactylosporangium matsuzakiense TaxID=53360 RepID=A0A9W6KDR7_9ACTN|nr:hypothetical protein GCM10017581_011580 [Dactylosporangium matsuzakiense]
MVHIRPARAADLPRLVAAHGQHHYFEQRIARQPKLGIVLLAERAGTVAGSAFLRLAPAEEWELRERLPKVPIFSHLEVLPEHRGNGVGTKILAAAEGLARGRQRRRMVLGVKPDDRTAFDLYSRNGYADWGLGVINALVVDYDDQGRRVHSTERCHIMIKDLGR